MSQFEINQDLTIMEHEGTFILTQFSGTKDAAVTELSRSQASVLAQRIVQWLVSESDRLALIVGPPPLQMSSLGEGYTTFTNNGSIDDNPYKLKAGITAGSAFHNRQQWISGFDAGAFYSTAE